MNKNDNTIERDIDNLQKRTWSINLSLSQFKDKVGTFDILAEKINNVINEEKLTNIKDRTGNNLQKQLNNKKARLNLRQIEEWEAIIKKLPEKILAVKIPEQPPQEIKKNDTEIVYSKTIIEKFTERYKKNLKEHIKHIKDAFPIHKFFADKLKLRERDITTFTSLFPEALFAFLTPSIGKNHVSHILPMTKAPQVRAYDTDKRTSNLDNETPLLNDFKGIVLGHAMSGFSDSAALLFELGRYKRLVHTLGLTGHVILVNKEWAVRNSGIQSLSQFGVDVNANVEIIQRLRKELYARLGFSLDNRTPDEIAETFRQQFLNNEKFYPKDIEADSKKYQRFAERLKGILSITDDRKLAIEIKKIRSQGKEAFESRFQGEHDWFDINDHHKKLSITETVSEYFKSLTEGTFYYVLMQRYSQVKYHGHLKVGVRSEVNFDHAFNIWNHLDGIGNDAYSLWCLYFNHYFFTNEDEHVIPYYFPSGGLGEMNPVEASEKAILLWDFTTEERKQKAKNLIAKLDIEQLATQFADILSFNFYFFPDKESNQPIIPLLKGFSDEGLYKSFIYFLKNKEDKMGLYIRLSFTALDQGLVYPYYYFPFIYAQHCKLESNNLFENELRELYYNVLMVTLENTIETINEKTEPK